MVLDQGCEDEIIDNDPALWSMGRDPVLVKDLKNYIYTYTMYTSLQPSESERN